MAANTHMECSKPLSRRIRSIAKRNRVSTARVVLKAVLFTKDFDWLPSDNFKGSRRGTRLAFNLTHKQRFKVDEWADRRGLSAGAYMRISCYWYWGNRDRFLDMQRRMDEEAARDPANVRRSAELDATKAKIQKADLDIALLLRRYVPEKLLRQEAAEHVNWLQALVDGVPGQWAADCPDLPDEAVAACRSAVEKARVPWP